MNKTGRGSLPPSFIPPFGLQVLLERRLLELRDQARRQEELLHRRVSSDQQREVLGLLCKVHELEVENTEIQSHALLKDSVIRQKSFVVQRFEQHRHLCDEIIQQQRQFIDGEVFATSTRSSSSSGPVGGTYLSCRANRGFRSG